MKEKAVYIIMLMKTVLKRRKTMVIISILNDKTRSEISVNLGINCLRHISNPVRTLRRS